MYLGHFDASIPQLWVAQITLVRNEIRAEQAIEFYSHTALNAFMFFQGLLIAPEKAHCSFVGLFAVSFYILKTQRVLESFDLHVFSLKLLNFFNRIRACLP